MAWTYLSMLAEIVHNEGGLVDDPNDRGGITNFGISLTFAQTHPDFFDLNKDGKVDAADIRAITPALAQAAYSKFFYEPSGLINIPVGYSNIAMQLFDMEVNMGVRMSDGESQAIKVLQHALGCNADGLLGPGTLAAFHTACNNEGVETVNNLIADARVHFYEQVVAAHPEDAKFLKGWKIRADKYRTP